MRKIDTAIVHCAATPADMDIGRDEIDQWHKDRGWSGVGYHYIIRRSGEIEVGRPITEIGAHVLGMNLRSIGICLVGGWGGVFNYTAAQMEALGLLKETLDATIPGLHWAGHRDFDPKKSCPCFDVRSYFGVRDPV